MKKLILFIAAVAISHTTVFSQGCLPDGITLTTQAQIDSFPINYPGCNEIEGSVTIFDYYYNNITNLNGLSVLKAIGGDVSIYGTFQLTNLTGLNNVTTIGGSLEFGNMDWGNGALTSLSGLEGLTSIGGCLCIGYCGSLTSIEALEGLTSVSGISLIGNLSLNSLTGLENLTSIPGGLSITHTSIPNLTGLEGLTTIGGSLVINASPLTSLTGLNNVISIGGDVYIFETDSLISLSGLNNVSSIGGDFRIGFYYSPNNALNSLTGLEGLTSIVGGLFIQHNPVLINLTGLENVSAINGDLIIEENNTLSDLNALNGLNAGSILNLSFHDNALLSDCNVQSICDYLVSPNGTVEISNNAPGCNSPEEVDAACHVGMKDLDTNHKLTIYPNPSSGQFTFEFYLQQPCMVNLIVHNNLGQVVATLADGVLAPGTHQVLWNTGNLPAGIYFCRLQIGERMLSNKIIKMK